MTNFRNFTFQTWVLILTGIWLPFSAFLLGYSSNSVARNNDIYAGVVILALTIASILWKKKSEWLVWVLGLVGLWQISAPFILDYSSVRIALVNEVTMGIIIVAFSLWEVMAISEEEDYLSQKVLSRKFGPTFASELKKKQEKEKDKN